MKFLPRHLGKKILSAAQHFKVILLLGARQTGKSTLFKHLLPGVKTIVFDPIQDLYEARKDPDRFLDLFPPPLVLDEVQFAPELLAAIKRRVDQNEHMGQYFLTGSQNFNVLKHTSESMAGRVAIFHLNPLTPIESVGLGDQEGWLQEYVLDPQQFMQAERSVMQGLPPLHEFLFRGTYPRAIELPLSELDTFFLSYVQTYVERDVRLVENIENLTLFGNFLRLAAACTAQEINDAQLGRELGLSSPTARKWLNLLIYTYQWIENPPYHGNTVKRLSEKRKGYFKDTGLACYFLRLHSPDALVTSTKLGSIFETWAINYVQEQASSMGCYHWRSHGGAEVDLVLERDGKLFPIEIKCKSRPNQADASSLRAFKQTYPHQHVQPGLIIHAGEETYPIDRDILALSWKAL